MANYDILGNIAILKFKRGTKKLEKLNQARELMKRENIKTVLEKTERFKGRLRTLTTKHLLGEKTKEALYKENSCTFRFNVDTCYFSPRLASERLEIANKIKPKDNVLVMFSGVAPFPIVISKHSKAKVTAIEINRKACKYAEENVKRNKVNVNLIQGDVKTKVPKLKEKFNIIVMPRPQLKETFLKQAFSVAKKGAIIYYYDFAKMQDKEKMIEKINLEAKNAEKKIKILKIKKAGELAPYKYRWRVDLKVNYLL